MDNINIFILKIHFLNHYLIIIFIFQRTCNHHITIIVICARTIFLASLVFRVLFFNSIFIKFSIIIVWQTNNALNFTCWDTVKVVFIDPALCTDVKEVLYDSNIDLYPNPVVNDAFILKFYSKRNSKIQIRLIDINGSTVLIKEIAKDNETIESPIHTKGIKPGFYILEINDGYELYRKSVLIQSDL